MSIASKPKSDYTEVKVWIVNNAFNGRLNVDRAPPSAEADEVGNINFSWEGAAAQKEHLGAIVHAKGEEALGMTVIEVDNSNNEEYAWLGPVNECEWGGVACWGMDMD